MANNLTGQNIQNTYQRVLHVGDDGLMYDGTGSLYTPLSASHEITTEVSSSHAITADQVGSFTAANIGQTYDTVANVSQGNITFTELDNGTDDLLLTNLTTAGNPEFASITTTQVRAGFPQINLKPINTSTPDEGPYHIRTHNDSATTPGVRFGNHNEDIIVFINQGGQEVSKIDAEGNFSGGILDGGTY